MRKVIGVILMIKGILSQIVMQSEIYLFVLNIFILLTLIILFVITRSTRRNWNKVDDYLGKVTKTINSIRYGDLTKKIEQSELPNSEHLANSLNRMIETLYDREQMVDEYQTELKRQNRLLEAVINLLSDGLIVVDEEYNILRATKKISEWFDLDGQKLIGKNLADFIELPNNINFEMLSNTDVSIRTDVSALFNASCMELKIGDKKKRFVVVLKNITDQRELENLKEDFVATLTHDLKVPIIAEKNMLELFLGESFGKISEKQEIALRNMQSSNKELLELVQTVLDTYKLKGNRIRLLRENIMLKAFINEIITEMTPIAEKSNNILKFSPIRDIRVYADRMQLKRVIKNLIQNAISYGESNSPIEIFIGEIPKYIVIKVKDYGAGIAPSDIDKIFNKYYSAANKYRKIGTGLGLYLAFQITKAHGGDLAVDSVVDEYTEFSVKLPAIEHESLFYGE